MRAERTFWPASMPLRTAAEYLECSVSQVERILRTGQLRCHTLVKGGERRLSRAALDDYIRLREVEGIAPRRGVVRALEDA